MNRGDHPARVRYCSDAGEPDNGGGPFQDHDVSPRMVNGRSILRLAQRVASVVSNSDIGAGDYPLLQPVGAENCVISCDLGIFADLAAEPVPAQYPDAGAPSRWIHAPGGRVLLQRPVRSVAVVVIGVLTQDQPQVPAAGDQHPVQALAAGTGDPPFGD